ncbi:hypothetical protein GY26_02310 [Gammaproteobacteria bacterium MFB021]|nr:hypothetical protein GY26_02310 [Gammaproteobacteria bacterium MFB021]
MANARTIRDDGRLLRSQRFDQLLQARGLGTIIVADAIQPSRYRLKFLNPHANVAPLFSQRRVPINNRRAVLVRPGQYLLDFWEADSQRAKAINEAQATQCLLVIELIAVARVPLRS